MRSLCVLSAVLVLLVSPPLLRAQPFPLFGLHVAVECNARCDLITVGQVCPRGFIPISIDCAAVKNQTGLPDARVRACNPSVNSPVVCSEPFPVSLDDPLDFYCEDVFGWDANVYCAPVPAP